MYLAPLLFTIQGDSFQMNNGYTLKSTMRIFITVSLSSSSSYSLGLLGKDYIKILNEPSKSKTVSPEIYGDNYSDILEPAEKN